MAFRLSDQHIEEYASRGATVFRGLLPPSLIRDLRRATDKARELAREVRGAQAQRLQPIGAFDLDATPFMEYTALPELREAIDEILGPQFEYGDLNKLGVLFEPAEEPYCTAWHRDARDNLAGFDITLWNDMLHDPEMMNQVNCPLYEDICTWIVPGSHLRDDLPRERELFSMRPIFKPELDGKTSEERERLCLEYSQSMPGGVQLILNAGDFALYRSSLWHIGNYVPYRKRATLHDGVMTPRGKKRLWEIIEKSQRRATEGHGVPDPYAVTPTT